MVAAVTASLLESPLDSLPAIEGRFVCGGMLSLRRGGRDPVPHLTFDHIQHPIGGRPGVRGGGMIGLASELSQM